MFIESLGTHRCEDQAAGGLFFGPRGIFPQSFYLQSLTESGRARFLCASPRGRPTRRLANASGTTRTCNPRFPSFPALWATTSLQKQLSEHHLRFRVSLGPYVPPGSDPWHETIRASSTNTRHRAAPESVGHLRASLASERTPSRPTACDQRRRSSARISRPYRRSRASSSSRCWTSPSHAAPHCVRRLAMRAAGSEDENFSTTGRTDRLISHW